MPTAPPGVIKMENDDDEEPTLNQGPTLNVNETINRDGSEPTFTRQNGIFYILIKKFQQFCEFPNRRQILKIDRVSEELRPYFFDKISNEDMDKDGDEKVDDTENGGNTERWSLSFEKLSFLFPNLRQIHFWNLYRFDDMVLEQLISWIQDERCKLKQIKFLYYDYSGSLDESEEFYDPDLLDKELLGKLKELKWKVSYPKEGNGTNGFVIRLQRCK